MKTRNNKILIGALLLGTLAFSSCKKEETPIVKNNQQATQVAMFKTIAEKQAIANSFFMKMTTTLPVMLSKTAKYMKTDDGIIDEDGFSCATVTIDSSSSPRIATYDFGAGCYDSNGVLYSGIISVQYTDPNMGTAGNHVVATFTNFTRDTLSFNGTFDFTNDGLNGGGNMIGHASYNMATNFNHDEIILNGVTNLTFEVIQPRNTVMFDFSGTATDGNGIDYTQTTTIALSQNQDEACKNHFVKGKLLIQSPSLPDQEIDYGNGDCDNIATSLVNGVSTTFTLD